MDGYFPYLCQRRPLSSGSLHGQQGRGVWLHLASPSYECVELSECEAGGCSVNFLRGNKGISPRLVQDNVTL